MGVNLGSVHYAKNSDTDSVGEQGAGPMAEAGRIL
jgi:hypothetical protein